MKRPFEIALALALLGLISWLIVSSSSDDQPPTCEHAGCVK